MPIVWALLAGFGLTVLVERLLVPRPSLRRPISCWAVHAGLWCVALAVLYGLSARPLFSAVNVMVLWLLIVLVNNAKYHSLREPFVCADFEFFSDAIRFPRLYLPFFGIGKALVMAIGFLLYLGGGLYFEAPAKDALGSATLIAATGLGLLWLGSRTADKPTFDASADLLRWGLAASLWRYFWAARAAVNVAALGSPFAAPRAAPAKPLPDVVSVQSESFFDVRTLWPGVRSEVLSQFDRLGREALAHGKLQVAAWGANTVRTEFAYLTGIPGERLGVHRFNPYRVLAHQGLPSIARQMQRLGYRTVCVHPYDGSFYGRDKVLPALGFDDFIDVRSFDDAQKAGPFIGDAAVAEKIAALLNDPARTQPLFIHAVTMENHGPLHLESVDAHELPNWFNRPLPEGTRDLAPYLRHIANADGMLGQLRDTLQALPGEALLCFFGDHVPILPQVYETLGAPEGDTDYLIWSNRLQTASTSAPLSVVDLGSTLLAHALSDYQPAAQHAKAS